MDTAEHGGPVPTWSPWGAIDGSQQLAPGIVMVSTPTHGGLWLSAERIAKIDPRWWAVTRGQPTAWLEEDQNWAIAAVSFPEAFNEASRNRADTILRNYAPDVYEAVFGVVLEPGQSHAKDAMAFAANHPEGCWLSTAFGDWHGLVPPGHVGVFVHEDPEAVRAAAAGNFEEAVRRERLAERTPVLVQASDWKVARRERHGWLGPESASHHEPWPVEATRHLKGRWHAEVYCPRDAVRYWKLPARSEEDTLTLVRAQNPISGVLLDAHAGRWPQVIDRLARAWDYEGESVRVEVASVALWLAARQGNAESVTALLDTGADPDWAGGVCRTAAFHHGHAQLLPLLSREAPEPAVAAFPTPA